MFDQTQTDFNIGVNSCRVAVNACQYCVNFENIYMLNLVYTLISRTYSTDDPYNIQGAP